MALSGSSARRRSGGGEECGPARCATWESVESPLPANPCHRSLKVAPTGPVGERTSFGRPIGRASRTALALPARPIGCAGAWKAPFLVPPQDPKEGRFSSAHGWNAQSPGLSRGFYDRRASRASIIQGMAHHPTLLRPPSPPCATGVAWVSSPQPNLSPPLCRCQESSLIASIPGIRQRETEYGPN